MTSNQGLSNKFVLRTGRDDNGKETLISDDIKTAVVQLGSGDPQVNKTRKIQDRNKKGTRKRQVNKKTRTRQAQDRNKTGTRKDQDRNKTGTRQKQERNKTGTRQEQDRDKIKLLEV